MKSHISASRRIVASVVALALFAQPILATAAGTQFSYSTGNQVAQMVLPQGQTHQYSYNLAGSVASYTQPNPATGGAGAAIQYGWDGQGTLAALTDPRGLVTAYGVTGHGDVASVASPDTGTSTFTYNEAGLPISQSDARGTATFSWDASGRLTSALYADSSATYTYDTTQQGRLGSMQDASGVTSFVYDSQGNLASRSQATTGPSGGQGATLTVQQVFDAAGRLSQLTYPSGRVVGFTYDASRVASITVDGVAAITGVQYRPFGPPSSWQMGAAGTFSRTFDSAGRITGHTYDNGQRTLTWDASNRLTGVTNPGTPQWTYTYDHLDRLATASEGVQGSRSFTLDATGNRTSTTIGGSAYNYSVNGESNRLATSTAPGSAASYQYDGAGQVLTDGTRYYTWTKGGHLASAEVGVNLTTYAYNGFGQRVKKVTGAGSAAAAKHYLYADDGVSLLGEYLQASAMAQVTATYEVVYLEGIPVLVLSGGQVFYIQSDHLNAPRTVKNAAGAVVWKWESDAFGNGAANQNPGGGAPFEFNLRFPGQQFDAETGLYYNNARYYDPSIGRYISSDPIGLAGGINTYGYAAQSPGVNTDPTGLWVPLAVSALRSVAIAARASMYSPRVNAVGIVGAEILAGTSIVGGGVGLAGFPAKAVVDGLADAAPSIAKVCNTTRHGFKRNNARDWRNLRDSWDDLGYSSLLSSENRAKIANGRTPVVDSSWVKGFPEDAGLLGERISMHHIGGYPVTVPLADTRHLQAHMPGGFRNNPGGPGSMLPAYP